MIRIPENLTGKQLFDWLIANKSLLMATKKSAIKEADAVSMSSAFVVNDKGAIVKSENAIDEAATKLDATLIINTTNYFDSHKDVHIPGLWKKSLQETPEHYHIKMHQMDFENVISDNVKAFTKKMLWQELGYNAPGTTEALVFNSIIDQDRNEYMFNQYKKGYVKNHSVGMRYVKLKMAINDKDYKEEFANWNEYIDDVVNRKDAEEAGYFWAILEAKVIEGSAVLRGSNRITPVYSIQSTKEESTEEQPAPATTIQPQATKVDWDKIATLFIN